MHPSPRLLLLSLALLLGLSTPAGTLLAAPASQEAVPLTITLTGTYETGVFDEAATEIVAYDAGSQRLFSINAFATTVDIIDFSDPENLTLIDQIDATEFGSSANSVAVYDGLVAVAVEGDETDATGVVVFFDTDGTYIVDVTVGVLPDMVTFTPDGTMVVVANEGEPSDDYTIDPLGSVSIIDLSDGVEGLTDDAVTTLDFTAFNETELDDSIRVFGPDATVAQDLEPEYVAVSPDSSTAWVAMQENNALAVVDLESKEISGLVGLGTKYFGAPVATLETFTFDNLPVLGTTDAGQEIMLGGFSGLYFEGIDPETGNLLFITHPDRGPNPDPIDTDGDGVPERPFALPDYQAQWVRFELNLADNTMSITEQVYLSRADGTPITGLPNLVGDAGMAYADELPIDLFGTGLENDPFGADMEGIVAADDGTYWMVDEYRPAIYHFAPDGTLIDRFVPEGSSAEVDSGVEALPAVLAQRRANRGFEAVAYDAGILYAFIQTPLDNPDTPNDANSRASTFGRVIAFDTVSSTTVGEYLYPFDGGALDKIGDAVALGDMQFLVIERDSALGPQAQKFIYYLDLVDATNLMTRPDLPIGPDGALERQNLAGLRAVGIEVGYKELLVDLSAIGYVQADKPEGLALIDGNTLAVIVDNDFGINPVFDPETGLLEENATPIESVVGIIRLHENGLDPSDRDDGINIGYWPVHAYYLPDAIATYEVDGETYIVTANEGDTRDYDGYSEEARIGDLILDWSDFPDAAALQDEIALGRLLTSVENGDLDGDGLVDKLYAIGARSFTIWRENGTIAFDSGNDFERITAEIYPDAFNSNGGVDDFDSRSDAKGPEPEAVTIGEIDGRHYAFIGLERIGGVMIYDVTDPINSFFVTYINNRDITLPADDPAAGDVGPESVTFVPADESPTGQNMLVVGNEVSGSISVYTIEATAE